MPLDFLDLFATPHYQDAACGYDIIAGVAIFAILFAVIMGIKNKIKPIEIPNFFYEIDGLDIWNCDENIDAISDNEVIFFTNEHEKVTHYDIVGKRYKLWGRKQSLIGVGSTREEVEANAPKLSKTEGRRWKKGYNRHVKMFQPYSMKESEFGFYRVACGTYAEFEFAKNNIVTRIRIGRLK